MLQLRYLLVGACCLISVSAYAQMTPEEQQLATAITGTEGAVNSGAANMAYLRATIAQFTQRKDQEITSLKTMIGSDDKRIKELQDELAARDNTIKGLEAKLKIVVKDPEDQQGDK